MRLRAGRPRRADTDISPKYARCPNGQPDGHRLAHDMLKVPAIDAENRALHIGRIGHDPAPEDRDATARLWRTAGRASVRLDDRPPFS